MIYMSYTGVQHAMGPTPIKQYDLTVPFADVPDKVIGIIGMGGIGFLLAKRAKAFNMKILYHNRNRR